MPNVVCLRCSHTRASTGYKSGRSSERGTPDTFSTARTLSGGTSSHCTIACTVIPRARARAAGPPTAISARSKASLLLVMVDNSSITVPQSQARLHCAAKVPPYNVAMTLGARIKKARVRLGMTQKQLGEHFGISDKAVSGWERDTEKPDLDKIPKLRAALRVNFAWLMVGDDEPPAPDAPEVLLDDLFAVTAAPVRAGIAKAISGLRKRS